MDDVRADSRPGQKGQKAQPGQPGQRGQTGQQLEEPPRERLRLDEAGLQAARQHEEDGALTPAYGPWRDDIVALLNDALATELVCVLRYRRHYFTAHGLASPAIADELLAHANAELGHADRIARRIVQLRGEPDLNPASLLERSHASYDDASDLKQMLRADLVAERVAVEAYRQMVALVGDKDATTRRLLEDILADEEEHADEIADWLLR